MTQTVDRRAPRIIQLCESHTCEDQLWEDAYLRFESPEDEIQKFLRRFRTVGIDRWRQDLYMVELFCGRGNGLVALERLGFRSLEGIDLSRHLLEQYHGDATLYVCDCRQLPFENESRDVVVVQGGLHHLPDLHSDLRRTVDEVHRILRSGGRFIVVEPWRTIFLDFVHRCAFSPLRKFSPKLDAFATMVDRERMTYERWLRHPAEIRRMLNDRFLVEVDHTTWGKLLFVGVKK